MDAKIAAFVKSKVFYLRNKSQSNAISFT